VLAVLIYRIKNSPQLVDSARKQLPLTYRDGWCENLACLEVQHFSLCGIDHNASEFVK
jgi:hypothetical protein